MEDLSSLEIWFGISNLESLKYIERKVQSIYVHPKFNDKNSFWNDIYLLRLDRPISYQYNIQPICLPCQVEGNLIYGSFSYETFFWGWGLYVFLTPPPLPGVPLGCFHARPLTPWVPLRLRRWPAEWALNTLPLPLVTPGTCSHAGVAGCLEQTNKAHIK